jgi:AcrR family transcriptional regulator
MSCDIVNYPWLMTLRTEGAAATRASLVRAASELLDEGGPGAVTLRAVGARAGVSRGAPYGHFADKEHLLRSLVVEAWNSLSNEVERIRSTGSEPNVRLEEALLALIRLARTRPHLYSLVFSTRADDLETARAASRLQEAFLAVVGDMAGPEDALRHGALLLSAAHGIAALEVSGHLDPKKWQVHGDEIVRTLVEALRSTEKDIGARSTRS